MHGLDAPVQDPGLRRSIGLVRASAIVVGIIIGASIFVQPSQVTGQVPSVRGVLAVWFAAGLLTTIGASSSQSFRLRGRPTGGVYVFLSRAYSRDRLPVGWAMFWTMHTGIRGGHRDGFARYVGTFVTLSPTGTRAVAIAAVALLSAVNYVGVRQASAVQAGLTLIKVVRSP